MKGEMKLARKLMDKYPDKFQSLPEARKKAREILSAWQTAKTFVVTGMTLGLIAAAMKTAIEGGNVFANYPMIGGQAADETVIDRMNEV